MGKVRVHELAKELDVPSRRIIDLLADIGFVVKNHMSVLEDEAVRRITYQMTGKGEPPAVSVPQKAESEKPAVSPATAAKVAKGNTPGVSVAPRVGNEKPIVKPGTVATVAKVNKGSTPARPQVRAPQAKTASVTPLPEKRKERRRGRADRLERKARREIRNRDEQQKRESTVVLEGRVTVGELADRLGVSVGEIIAKLMNMGIMATINQFIDVDVSQVLAEEYGFRVEVKLDPVEAGLVETVQDREEDLRGRPPVVTVLGHVDHGKTSLLDAIRMTNVTAREAGGITQHIGAYQAEVAGKKVVFLDTPGHEAFTAMRARGAQVTDIAIVVVAADDGVMPQTVEAINHVKAAGVPIIVAVNKIDKAGANPDRVKQQLAEYGLVSEEWGGDTVFVHVSALKRQGMETLLEMILLVAEMAELKANPTKPASGTVVEARLDKGRGPVATVLIQDGTLYVGDPVIAGSISGKVRAMVDDKGKRLKKAGPSTPVEVLGLTDLPQAGDVLQVVNDERAARQIAERRQEKRREISLKKTAKVSLEDLFKQIQEGEVKDLNLILKADVQGSVEAMREALLKLESDEVRLQVLHGGVGVITESDVMLASASNAIIIGFNVRPEPSSRKMAEREHVDIRLYRVIYEAIEDIKAAMTGMLAPRFKEVVLGQAEVRQIFKVSRLGTIAGCHVIEGKITRNAGIRIVRDGVVVHEGKIETLKRFKEDTKEVVAGYECGILLEKFHDFQEGDLVESYTMQQLNPV
ncbi:MAG: translation initiation factor IF-2 [Firmicutes bacterium]|nr:translation initiation factor IF-2 [Bacillota bacterium]